jgi:hypothetical protein
MLIQIFKIEEAFMAKRALISLTIILTLAIIFSSACKTAEEAVKDFIIASTSGYSKKMTTLDPDDKGLTSINLFFAIRNKSDAAGRITRWVFKIRHNIVTLLEINQDNYQDYNLVLSGDASIPADEIREIYVSTPQPILENSLSHEKVSFDDNIPTEIIVEVEVTDGDGNIQTITGAGQYVYEQGVINESRYNIVGEWKVIRTINGAKQGTQKLVFVGTKISGQFVLYEGLGDTAQNNGTYVVSNYKYITFTAANGDQYWGEFTDTKESEGTLLLPYDDRGRPQNKTGTWTATKK